MEEFFRLENIVAETIKRTLETQNFDMQMFLKQMEAEFTYLGFRDESAKGGGRKHSHLVYRACW